MKPIFYMAIGALIPVAAYELMNSKAYKDMKKKLIDKCLCKCNEIKSEDNQSQTTNC